MRLHLRTVCVISLCLWMGLGWVRAADAAVPAADAVQHVRIVGGSYFFKPNHVVVKVGVPVELTLSMEAGLIPHTFMIHAPEAGIVVDESLAGEPHTVLFTPQAVGRYVFYCKNRLLFFKSHQEEGMEGILDVVE